jgi:RNA-directed DNA polymerase
LFGDRGSGAYMRKFAWTTIVRHQIVTGTSSPDDPDLGDYWARRRRKGPPPPMDRADPRLLQAQHGRCPLCGGLLLHADHEPQTPREWEQWLTVTRKAMTKQAIVLREQQVGTSDETMALTHASCARRHTHRPQPGASASPRAFTACLSRVR